MRSLGFSTHVRIQESNADGKRKARGRGEGLNGNNRRQATKMPKLATADLDSSRQAEEEGIDQRVEILRRGQKKELQRMIDNYEDDINEYSFGANKTLLLEAVINCPNPAVVDMIMEKGADVDKEEYQTGNTALFLSAVDLKVNFVRNLLKYQPNLQHKNHNNQNIFEFLNYQLFEQRRKFGRELTEDERERYNEIEDMLRQNE